MILTVKTERDLLSVWFDQIQQRTYNIRKVVEEPPSEAAPLQARLTTVLQFLSEFFKFEFSLKISLQLKFNVSRVNLFIFYC